MTSTLEKFLKNTSLISYSEDRFERDTYELLEDIVLKSDSKDVFWVNTYGFEFLPQFKNIIRNNNLDDFLLKLFSEDDHPNKVIELDNLLFISIRVLKTEKAELDSEQMLFVLSEDFVWSIQERPGDYFQWIRERLETNKGMVRRKRADYLFFLILESIVDNYHDTFEIYSEANNTELSPSQIKPTPEFTASIEQQRGNLFQLKKATSSLRDTIIKIESANTKDLKKKYFNELKEQTSNLISDIDFELQDLDSKMNLIFSIQGHRLNEVMKTLTIFSVIFIPLTFLAGIYGMNFEYMPELRWPNGYFIALGVMLLITVATIWYIARKKWF